MNYKLNAKIKFRYEYYGGLIWFIRGKLFKTDKIGIAIVSLFIKPRNVNELKEIISYTTEWEKRIEEFIDENIILIANETTIPFLKKEYEEIKDKIEVAHKYNNVKPFWVHIQPFSYCNQSCIHCYCNGGKNAPKFVHTVETWKKIIDRLDSFGVIDIYLTGGETLILQEAIQLLKYITLKGFGTGISTNAMEIEKNVILELKNIGIKRVQVSLDSVVSDKHDYIRGKIGAFKKTLVGINNLIDSGIQVSLNTVVNKMNFNEIEEIVKFGKKFRIEEYSFFPQKSCGRGKNKFLLLENEVFELANNCEKIEMKYNISIDYLSENKKCGAAISGFAIDENGDLFPCIFGVRNEKLKFGNIIQNEMEELWFNSDKINKFRKIDNSQPCKRCE